VEKERVVDVAPPRLDVEGGLEDGEGGVEAKGRQASLQWSVDLRRSIVAGLLDLIDPGGVTEVVLVATGCDVVGHAAGAEHLVVSLPGRAIGIE
jgi:hypothetical protein